MSDRSWGRRDVVTAILIGLAAGLLSGLFGIGGGTIIVPALVWCGLSQRQAAATSLAAIVPTSMAAVIPYILAGRVAWAAAGLLVVGVVCGARIGAHWLARLPERVLRWGFVGFLALVAVSQFLFTPQRDGAIDLSWASGAGLVGLGLVTGVLAALLGVGGGVVVVPSLSLIFGASDLIARGTSLLMMLPGAVSGTLKNSKNQLVDLKAAALIGLPAIAMTPFGSLLAEALSARLNTVLFGVYVSALLVRSVFVALRRPT
ncbi:MAG: sulfite exporter TauE/SafE family protein [Propionibacteriaceae bacterium]|jgi:uncharacterized membrane protein YfcA|nr:sulfite exporter TauE/SafE family protein [Propionibacteriaceae bacterium]